MNRRKFRATLGIKVNPKADDYEINLGFEWEQDEDDRSPKSWIEYDERKSIGHNKDKSRD